MREREKEVETLEGEIKTQVVASTRSNHEDQVSDLCYETKNNSSINVYILLRNSEDVSKNYRCCMCFMRVNNSSPNRSNIHIRLMATHDDYSMMNKLAKEKTSVVTILRNSIDRVFSTYEVLVEVAARFLVHPNLASATQMTRRTNSSNDRTSTLDIWPWKYLVPWMREDIFARVGHIGTLFFTAASILTSSMMLLNFFVTRKMQVFAHKFALPANIVDYWYLGCVFVDDFSFGDFISSEKAKILSSASTSEGLKRISARARSEVRMMSRGLAQRFDELLFHYEIASTRTNGIKAPDLSDPMAFELFFINGDLDPTSLSHIRLSSPLSQTKPFIASIAPPPWPPPHPWPTDVSKASMDFTTITDSSDAIVLMKGLRGDVLDPPWLSSSSLTPTIIIADFAFDFDELDILFFFLVQTTVILRKTTCRGRHDFRGYRLMGGMTTFREIGHTFYV
ncbi:hypothetical protein Syun_016858 [Stephania yunnanensis]|uniref:Uncharacterized protein n=1 Tax=Stephania yunnanensis TaxID=152371 RepID=A0AAP0J5P9_9MAGN